MSINNINIYLELFREGFAYVKRIASFFCIIIFNM